MNEMSAKASNYCVTNLDFFLYLWHTSCSCQKDNRNSHIKYDIINDRYPDKPIVRLYINDINSSNNVNIEWIFDSHKLNQEFSSHKIVSEFIKNKNTNHPLLLMEI
jgi:uncharacterized protein YchJ